MKRILATLALTTSMTAQADYSQAQREHALLEETMRVVKVTQMIQSSNARFSTHQSNLLEQSQVVRQIANDCENVWQTTQELPLECKRLKVHWLLISAISQRLVQEEYDTQWVLNYMAIKHQVERISE